MKTNRRNENGVKSSSDLYRTFNGEEYICWMSHPSSSLVAEYRAAGIRCRRQKVELFVHHMDVDQARDIERARA